MWGHRREGPSSPRHRGHPSRASKTRSTIEEPGQPLPHENWIGFLILAGNGLELMYQSRASLRSDIPAFAEMRAGEATALFVEVENLDAVETAMQGAEVVMPRRRSARL